MSENESGLGQFYRTFLRVDISIGLTYARLAMRAYEDGHRTQGDQIAAKAMAVAADVDRCLEDANAGGCAVHDLFEEAHALRAALTKLPPPVRLAA